MRNCSPSLNKVIEKEVCLKSFKITAFLSTEQQLNDYTVTLERFMENHQMKVIHLCYWLDGRFIPYQLSFCYNKDMSISMNFSKFRNFLRLKYRIRHSL